MRDELLEVNPDAASGKSNVEVDVHSESASVPARERPYRVPLFIPRHQAYYWTREWQEDEAKALEELERGEGVIFHNPDEAVRWLMSPEDE
jgi:hypothetical protein